MSEPISEYIATIFLAVLLLWCLYRLVRQAANGPLSKIPGPTVLDYVTKGSPLNRLIRDPRKSSGIMFELHEQFGDVFRLPQGLFTSVATTNPEDMSFIISNDTAFVKTFGVQYTMNEVAPGNLFIITGADHQRLRKHFQNTFNSSLLSGFHRILADSILEGSSVLSKLVHFRQQDLHNSTKLTNVDRQLYDTFVTRGHIDITAVLTVISLRAISAVCFGVTLSVEERQVFLEQVEQLSNEMLKDVMFHPVRQYFYKIPLLGPYFSRVTFNTIKARLRQSCLKFVSTRLAEWNDSSSRKPTMCRDLTDAILMVDHENVEFVINHTMTFALAGSVSTNQAIAWAIFELIKPENRHAYESSRKEVDNACRHLGHNECMDFDTVGALDFLKAVWKETLRLHPAFYTLARQSTKDVTLPGSQTHIPKGTVVQALSQVAQCDERYFGNALSFQPQRWLQTKQRQQQQQQQHPLSSYVPFGLGAHSCPGKFFAEHEGIFVLAELLRRFDFSLSCRPNDVVTCSGMVEVGKFSSASDGNLDMGIPVSVTERTTWT